MFTARYEINCQINLVLEGLTVNFTLAQVIILKHFTGRHDTQVITPTVYSEGPGLDSHPQVRPSSLKAFSVSVVGTVPSFQMQNRTALDELVYLFISISIYVRCAALNSKQKAAYELN